MAVAAEQVGYGIGRIRLRRVADVSAAGIESFALEAVEPGGSVAIDEAVP